MLTIVCRTKVSNNIYFVLVMISNILKKFGKSVKEERVKMSLSQEELADRAGVHRTYIGMIERAEKNITLENIEKIAKGLNVPISELLK